jgi:hypothetical protein
VFKENRTTDQEIIRKNHSYAEEMKWTLWIRSMDHRKSRPEKTRGFRDLVLDDDAEDKMDE